MADIDEALARFTSANPGVTGERARLLVETGTRAVPGGITWKFDTGLEMFWTGMSVAENEAAMVAIACPVLIVTGERSLDYWSANQPGLAGQRQFYESELKRRQQLFSDARHEVLKGAGHMLHYDEPQALGAMVSGFLAEH